MMCELISVIVPVYNVEKYLDKCIESIVNQTYQHIEIILVDDCSTDTSLEICNNWAKRDNRIVVIHKNNEGIGIARNTGIEFSKGDYIVFVDSDDLLNADAIEVMYSRIQYDKSDVAIGNFVKLYPDGTIQNSSYNWMYDTVVNREEALHMIGSDTTPLHCCSWAKLYKKQIFDGIRFSTLKASEDMQIWPCIINKSRKISIVSQVVYLYLQRETSIVHNLNNDRQKDRIIATLLVARYMMDLGIIDVAKKYYRSAVYYIASTSIQKSEARRLLHQYFSFKDRIKLTTMSMRMFVYWIGMYIPGVFKFVSFCKRCLGHKSN